MLQLDVWYWNVRSGGASGQDTHECSLSSLMGTAVRVQSHHTRFFLAMYTNIVPATNWECYPLHQRIGDYSFMPKTPASYLLWLNHHIICGKKVAGSKIRLQRFKMSLSDKCRPWVFKSTHNQILNLTITACLRHQEYKYRLDKFCKNRSIKSPTTLLIKSKGSGVVSAVVGIS